MPRSSQECPESKLVRSRFRNALLALGRSPDSHIYDLDQDFFDHRPKGEALSFIRKVRLFYECLAETDRRLFLKECLEKDRHYRFWYLDQYEDKSFYAAYSKMQQRIKGLVL